MNPTRALAIALVTASALAAGTAQASDPYVNATVGGAISPGVYGRIDIGSAPPPPLIYAQPLVIARPRVVVPVQPVYLYVPPGHAKHCHKYNACAQPVYFVRVDDDHRQDHKKQKHKHH